MSRWNRRNQVGDRDSGKNDEHENLLVFGYASRLFANDENAERIAEERHMQSWNNDGSVRVDRYDCRLLLTSLDEATSRKEAEDESCPTEAMEEEMCEEERYRDMYRDIQEAALREEKRKRETAENRKAQFGFNYGTDTVKVKEESDSDTRKIRSRNHIIERTATFVVANGAQMEIVIKAKQRHNVGQFGFLEFDHPLNPYYKYVQKLIREKKYMPDATRKSSKPGSGASTPVNGKGNSKPTTSSALAAIAEQHGSDSDDDSDSDCELHPSLLAAMGKRAPSPDIRDSEGMSGPRGRPKLQPDPPRKASEQDKPNYEISKGNDVYASLFKSLAQVTQLQVKPKEEPQQVKQEPPSQPQPQPQPQQKFKFEVEPQIIQGVDADGRVDDPGFREWYASFYGTPCPWRGPKVMVPPSPDLEPVVTSYAEYVARRGVDVERSLALRQDLKLEFMQPHNPHFSYYQHRVRMIQWHISQEQHSLQLDNQAFVGPQKPAGLDSPKPMFDNATPPPPFMALNSPRAAPPPPPPPPPQAGVSVVPAPVVVEPQLNRKQRRRLQEATKFADVPPPPGVVDPVALKAIPPVTLTEIPKIQSAPSLLQAVPSEPNLIDPLRPQISFTVTAKKAPEEGKTLQPSVLVEEALDEALASTSTFDPDILDSPTTFPQDQPATSLQPNSNLAAEE
ncbi:unnamed protein product [Caenorhabditis auriculariae]|uniref:SURP motif domain-containing protein n=1 Tax=Caenorhabditis auriculariae TaxID=2777116 RepID=A0A8S1I059_9PELO|nr:unnamed protein product [Caenorhabditis auriculariae]